MLSRLCSWKPERFPEKNPPVAPSVRRNAFQISSRSSPLYLRENGSCSFGAAFTDSPRPFIRIFNYWCSLIYNILIYHFFFLYIRYINFSNLSMGIFKQSTFVSFYNFWQSILCYLTTRWCIGLVADCMGAFSHIRASPEIVRRSISRDDARKQPTDVCIHMLPFPTWPPFLFPRRFSVSL